jgi:FdhE protein
LALPHLPLGELLPFFDAFLAEMSDVGTAVMVAEAAALAGAPSPERRAVVATALGDEDAAAASFHARAFAEIVATTLAARVLPAAGTRSPGGGYEPDDAAPARCRVCGALPVVATLRDQPGALGSRGLVCSRCGTERRFRRLTCAWCGESSADRLTIHSPESVPHVRLDECGSCRRYMKTIDLRRRGDAVPIVEDLATPELDLWAAEAGLARVRESLFGLRAID